MVTAVFGADQTKLFRSRSRTNIEHHVTCVNMGSAVTVVCVTDVIEMVSCTEVSTVTSRQGLDSCLFVLRRCIACSRAKRTDGC